MPESELPVRDNPLRNRLAHQFETLYQQRHADTLGMWIFLATEVLFFGGLITAYVMYRSAYPLGFAQASRSTDILAGAVMTVVMLGSSFTMAMAVRNAQLGRRGATARWIAFTIVLGCGFLAIKGLEYYHHWEEHHFPGPGWSWEGPYSSIAELFMYFYYALTGLHATHMVIGVGVLTGLLVKAGRNKLRSHTVEISALYWHFVDIVWIFLYPLLYLADRHK